MFEIIYDEKFFNSCLLYITYFKCILFLWFLIIVGYKYHKIKNGYELVYTNRIIIVLMIIFFMFDIFGAIVNYKFSSTLINNNKNIILNQNIIESETNLKIDTLISRIYDDYNIQKLEEIDDNQRKTK